MIWQQREITHILVLEEGAVLWLTPQLPRKPFLLPRGVWGAMASPHVRAPIFLVWTGVVCPRVPHAIVIRGDPSCTGTH